MSIAACPNCGAALIVGAKFCRQCGRLAEASDQRSVTEATTRTLHTPVDYAAQPTNILSSQPTGPTYLAPGQMQQPTTQAIVNPEQRGRQLNTLLIVLLATLILFVGALFAFGIVKLNSPTTTQPPAVPVGEPPTDAIPDPPPPLPPPPPARPGSNSISRAFIYPGAETVMDMTRAGGGNMLQLRTKDSYEKVLDWYVARLKPESIIKSPGQNAVLKSDKLMAIINATDEGTMIMLKQPDEIEIDIDE